MPTGRVSRYTVPRGWSQSRRRAVAHRSPQQNGTAHLTEGIAIQAVKTWTVQVDVDEHEDRTRAVARLRTGQDQSLAGSGFARLNPADRNVPRIGDELAVARALSELSHLLLDVAAREIEQASGVPAHPAL